MSWVIPPWGPARSLEPPRGQPQHANQRHDHPVRERGWSSSRSERSARHRRLRRARRGHEQRHVGHHDEPEPFLREALGLIVEVTGARQGYVELHDDDHTGAPRWSLAHGFTAEQLASVRAALSRGIIAEALATGKT